MAEHPETDGDTGLNLFVTSSSLAVGDTGLAVDGLRGHRHGLGLLCLLLQVVPLLYDDRGVAGGVTSGLTDTSIGDVEAQEGGFYGQEGVAGTSTGLSPELAKFIGSTVGREAAQLTAQNLAPSQTGRQAPPPSGQVSTPPPVGDVTTTGQPAPGSSALAQALRAGSPVIGGGDGETSARPVWNIASLRVKDETGS